MLPVNSSAVVAQSAAATLPIAVPEPRPIPIQSEGERVRRHAHPPSAGPALKDWCRRTVSVLVGFGEIVIIGWTFPLVILAVGIPIALIVRLVMRLVGAL